MVKRTPAFMSLIERLKANVTKFGLEMDQHISQCRIRYRGNLSTADIFILAPDHCWDRNDPQDQIYEMKLMKTFKKWWITFAPLFSNAGKSLEDEITNLKTSWETWIERSVMTD